MHALGNMGTGIVDGKLSEGYTELFNPNHRKDVYPNERTMVIILEQIYGKDFMRKAYANQSLFNDMYERFNIEKTDPNEHWDLIRDVNSFLIKCQGDNLRVLYRDPEISQEFENIIQRLKNEYTAVTGKEWDDNEVLKICYDMLTGEHTSDRHEGFTVTDVFFDKNGDYRFEMSRGITRVFQEHIEPTSVEETRYTSLSGESYEIHKDFGIEEK